MSESEENQPAPIEEIDASRRMADRPVFSHEEHRAKTTKQLAFTLLVALFVVFAAHVVSVLALAQQRPDSVDQINRVFNVWIPVFSGLVGAAATFYFTQNRR